MTKPVQIQRRKCRKPNEREIKAALKQLRHLIDSSKNPAESRIAYAMEMGIRWATEESAWDKNSHSQSYEACELAKLLREELNK